MKQRECCEIRLSYNAKFLKLTNEALGILKKEEVFVEDEINKFYIIKKLAHAFNTLKNKCSECGIYYDRLYQQGGLRELENYYNRKLTNDYGNRRKN